MIDQNITGKNVHIMIVDSAFELTHPDLHFSNTFNLASNNKDITPNNLNEFHGTSVAGVIGANKGNNYATMGVAPDAYLVAINGLFEIEEDMAFTEAYLRVSQKTLVYGYIKMKFSFFLLLLLFFNGCDAKIKNDSSKNEEIFSHKESVVMETKNNPIPQKLYILPTVEFQTDD